MLDTDSEIIQSMNTKLQVNNFPETHTKEEIRKICGVFGNVKSIDLIKDTLTGQFKGSIHVEYTSEIEAKRAHSSMMGFKIDENVLFVKKLTTITAPNQGGMEGEMFKALIEDKPTECLMIKNIVSLEEIESRIDYKELEFDV
mmetsp:Transcript_31094/g.42240  ORF Transcript_31094/g.42240 Transcript_31094/m.42240 type:complete len:143 (+) Transcript_31094:634-1062(+)|eukprot:CAMPEP_0176371984 /NCGR_PEP_ID=MMETSP0126-20121128/25077_1 /TAXON_ID=141414 ORGANISM="Strombidinopsis acuminatum, Strain SPMC142" /NCGR_SAMPLE_ID=MMETSP0126 /ASSEMBLY_ACC=CAM_ASM_000229 /LENGTH=142 /DNA_ID=CAMNT_0017731653 /DNA_START=634 /DNA_END=1062 /DNA_ORIENTATION=+